MSDVTPVRTNVPLPGSQFLAAVSEYIAQSIAGSINFINSFQYDEKEFFLNGPYGQVVSVPVLGLDGLYVFPFNAEIINYAMFNLVAGSSGTTALDIKRATSSGGTFTSIFSVTPKIASTATANTYFLGYTITKVSIGQSWAVNGSPPTGVTIGTFTSVPFNVSAGDAIRVDLTDRMPAAQNCGLVVHFRPR